MSEIQSCLPQHARIFFIELRNQKQEFARTSFEAKRRDLRNEAAARGHIRSGHQELAEWQLSQQYIGNLAYGYFEAAIETCTLYQIHLDKALCKCIDTCVRDFLLTQQKNVLHASGTVPGSTRVPLSVRQQMASGRSLPRYNEIRIALERARVESDRVLESPRSPIQKEITMGPNHESRRNRPDVLNVLIASPSDVGSERDAAVIALHAWNAGHSETTHILLNPLRWETHSYPESGDRPQGLLNRQIVEKGDFLIGIFGSRLGSPTGVAESGTIEEIEHFRSTGKYVALYFSEADVPRNVDRAQLDAVENYKRDRQSDTLFGVFRSADELRDKLQQDLTKIVASVGAPLRLGLWTDVVPTTRHSESLPLPLKLNVAIAESSENGSILQVSANRSITATQIDYLDYQNIRISTEKLSIEGQNLRITLPHAELVKIWNLRPNGVVPIHFRLHVLDGDQAKIETIDAGLQEAWKMVGSASTFYLQVLA